MDEYNTSLIVLIIFLAVILLFAIWKRKMQLGKLWGEGKKVAINNKELCCHHCGCKNFKKIEGLLNTSTMMFFLLGFLNKSASCFICSDCGFVHWFFRPEEKIFKEFDRDEF